LGERRLERNFKPLRPPRDRGKIKISAKHLSKETKKVKSLLMGEKEGSGKEFHKFYQNPAGSKLGGCPKLGGMETALSGNRNVTLKSSRPKRKGDKWKGRYE